MNLAVRQSLVITGPTAPVDGKGEWHAVQTKVRNRLGVELSFSEALRQMNAGLLADLQSSEVFKDSQALFEAYAEAHVQKFHQSFAPFSGGRW